MPPSMPACTDDNDSNRINVIDIPLRASGFGVSGFFRGFGGIREFNRVDIGARIEGGWR